MPTQQQIDAAALALMDELYDGRASLPKDHPAWMPIYGVCFKRARIALEAGEEAIRSDGQASQEPSKQR